MIRINRNLALFSGIVVILSTLFISIIQKFSPLFGHATYYCQSFVKTHMIAIPQYLSGILVAFLLLLLALAVIRFFVVSLRAMFLKKTLKRTITINPSIQKVINNLALEEKTVIVKSTEHFAFCLGVGSAEIYISTGLLSQLTIKEIEAVLRHEQYHLENHDTFTMIVACVAQSLFPFFPVIGDLIHKYKIEREIRADSFAIEKIGDSSHLIAALKKLLVFPAPRTFAVAFADHDTLESRIYSLLNRKYSRRKFSIRNVLITFFSGVVLGVLIAVPVYAKEIHHDQHDAVMVCLDNRQCVNSCVYR